MKKNSSYLLFFVLVFCGIASCVQKPVSTEIEKEKVKLVVDQFEEFWETEDMGLLSKIMAHDSEMINYGSDASEIFVGWEAFRDAVEKMLPAFDKTKIAVKDQIIKVHPSGNVAWFSEIWDWDLIYGDQAVLIENQRLTGVLEKRNGNWVFVQFHNSVPVTE